MRQTMWTTMAPILLAAAGTAALAYSWSFEKHELSSATEEVNRLQRSQLVVDLDEIMRDQWLIALNQELNGGTPNPDYLAAVASGTISCLAKWQSHMEMRVTDQSLEYAAIIAARETSIAQARQLADSGDYKALLQLLRQLNRTSGTSKSTAELDRAFFARVAEADARLQAVETAMRRLYLLGTAALLLGSVFSSLMLDKSMRRVERQLAAGDGLVRK